MDFIETNIESIQRLNDFCDKRVELFEQFYETDGLFDELWLANELDKLALEYPEMDILLGTFKS